MHAAAVQVMRANTEFLGATVTPVEAAIVSAADAAATPTLTFAGQSDQYWGFRVDHKNWQHSQRVSYDVQTRSLPMLKVCCCMHARPYAGGAGVLRGGVGVPMRAVRAHVTGVVHPELCGCCAVLSSRRCGARIESHYVGVTAARGLVDAEPSASSCAVPRDWRCRWSLLTPAARLAAWGQPGCTGRNTRSYAPHPQ